MAESSSLTIETVSDGTPKRLVELRGPALPHQGASWKGKLSIVTEWYNANSEATQQVLGPQEVPSDWEGMWRRTMMGRSPSRYRDDQVGEVVVTTPFFLMTALEAIFRSGARLRVTWTAQKADGKVVSIVREGRAETWEFPVDRPDDIGWKITWAWAGRGGSQVKVASTRDGSVTSTIDGVDLATNELATALDGTIVSSSSKIRKSASRFTLGQLEALANAPNLLMKGLLRGIQQKVGELKRIADVVNTVRALPFSLSNQALDAAKNTIALVRQTRLDFASTPPELYTTKRGLSDITRAAKYFGGAADAAQTVARRADDLQVRVRKQNFNVPGAGASTTGGSARQDDLLGVHRVKAGETPSSISLKWYRTTAHGVDIMRANKRSWYEVTIPPGTFLIIPRLTTNQGS